MDIDKVIKVWNAGKLGGYALDELCVFSAACVPYITRCIPPAKELKAAIDEEIRRKEAAKAEKRAVDAHIALATIKQKREDEHTLTVYWRLGTWQERFGIAALFVSVFMLGFGAAQIPALTAFLNFIKALKP